MPLVTNVAIAGVDRAVATSDSTGSYGRLGLGLFDFDSTIMRVHPTAIPPDVSDSLRRSAV